jgi:hypothetical protein
LREFCIIITASTLIWAVTYDEHSLQARRADRKYTLNLCAGTREVSRRREIRNLRRKTATLTESDYLHKVR